MKNEIKLFSLLKTLQFIINHPLNKNNKSRALISFIRWQIGSRLVPGSVIYEWINGSKFIVTNGQEGLTGNIYTGLHEYNDMAFLLHFLRKNDIFIDCGANLGSYSILAGAAIGAMGYAYEPTPSFYIKLKDNMRLNYIDHRFYCSNKFIGAQEGEISFVINKKSKNRALAPEEKPAGAIKVKVTTLDNDLINISPNLIKIDVEGYEFPILRGALKILKKKSLNAVIIELNGSGKRYGWDDREVLDLMLNNNFSTYTYDPLKRRLLKLNNKVSKQSNTLFVRNIDYVMDRLKSAPYFKAQNKII